MASNSEKPTGNRKRKSTQDASEKLNSEIISEKEEEEEKIWEVHSCMCSDKEPHSSHVMALTSCDQRTRPKVVPIHAQRKESVHTTVQRPCDEIDR